MKYSRKMFPSLRCIPANEMRDCTEDQAKQYGAKLIELKGGEKCLLFENIENSHTLVVPMHDADSVGSVLMPLKGGKTTFLFCFVAW